MKKWALGLALCFVAGAFASFGCQSQSDIIDVYLPDGAPALALALPMYEDAADDGVEYHVVSATTLHTFATGKNPDAEVCVMPVNAAAKLLGDASAYQMAGVLTHGNLYLLAKEDTAYTRENISDLVGKTIGVLQLNNVPGLTLKACLNGLSIPYTDLTAGDEFSGEAVNLRAVPTSPMTMTGADLYLLPSPEADWRVDSGEWKFVGDLQALYGDGTGYPQAVIVVKKEVLEKRGDWVRSFLAKIDEGAAWLQSAEKSVIAGAVQAHLTKGLTPKFTAENLTDGAIARSGICMQRMDGGAVAEVKAFLQELLAVDGSFAAMPSDGFFWLAVSNQVEPGFDGENPQNCAGFPLAIRTVFLPVNPFILGCFRT